MAPRHGDARLGPFGLDARRWRRVRLPATTTLEALRRIIRVAFDWDDDHLHVFIVDGRRYADRCFSLVDCGDETRMRVGRVLPRGDGSMSHVYDLGDWWEHQITVERIIESDDDAGPTCVGGRGDAPARAGSPPVAGTDAVEQRGYRPRVRPTPRR